jgi:hypothetical protein
MVQITVTSGCRKGNKHSQIPVCQEVNGLHCARQTHKCYRISGLFEPSPVVRMSDVLNTRGYGVYANIASLSRVTSPSVPNPRLRSRRGAACPGKALSYPKATPCNLTNCGLVSDLGRRRAQGMRTRSAVSGHCIPTGGDYHDAIQPLPNFTSHEVPPPARR